MPLGRSSLWVDLPPPLHGYYWENHQMIGFPLVMNLGGPWEMLKFLRWVEAKPKAVAFITSSPGRADLFLAARGYEHFLGYMFEDQGLIDGRVLRWPRPSLMVR